MGYLEKKHILLWNKNLGFWRLKKLKKGVQCKNKKNMSFKYIQGLLLQKYRI